MRAGSSLCFKKKKSWWHGGSWGRGEQLAKKAGPGEEQNGIEYESGLSGGVGAVTVLHVP